MSGIKMPYRVREVADMVGCSNMTILREIESGRLHARKKRGQKRVWYITEEDLKEWTKTGMWD